jgi:hypothetical protein
MEYIDIAYNEEMLKNAVQAVVGYFNTLPEGRMYITKDEVCIVWFCKTLQNYKVILATPLINNMLYEFSYNGDKQEGYLDVYNKCDTKVVVNVTREI